MVAATVGWHGTTLVPFDPLELQNRQLWGAQLVNIAAYYAALFPFFFLVGLYISLVFVLHARHIGRVYAADLGGAGLGRPGGAGSAVRGAAVPARSPASCRCWRWRLARGVGASCVAPHRPVRA